LRRKSRFQKSGRKNKEKKEVAGFSYWKRYDET